MRVDLSKLLVNIDQFCDYVPGVSTITNLVDIVQKCVVLPRMGKVEIEESRYYTHLQKKDFARSIILLVPVLGNVVIGMSDCSGCVYGNRDYMLIVVQQDSQMLGYASEELRNDKEVVLVAVRQDGLALGYASEQLKNDPEVVRAAVQQNSNAIMFASQLIKTAMLAAV